MTEDIYVCRECKRRIKASEIPLDPETGDIGKIECPGCGNLACIPEAKGE